MFVGTQLFLKKAITFYSGAADCKFKSLKSCSKISFFSSKILTSMKVYLKNSIRNILL